MHGHRHASCTKSYASLRAHTQKAGNKVISYPTSQEENSEEFIDDDINLGHKKQEEAPEKHWRPGSTDDAPPSSYS